MKKFTYDEIVGDEIVFRPAKTIKKIVRVPLLRMLKLLLPVFQSIQKMITSFGIYHQDR